MLGCQLELRYSEGDFSVLLKCNLNYNNEAITEKWFTNVMMCNVVRTKPLC